MYQPGRVCYKLVVTIRPETNQNGPFVVRGAKDKDYLEKS